jgi:hypothetical protein
MNQAVYEKLDGVARARGLNTYAEVGCTADLDVNQLPDLYELVKLREEIADYEIELALR